MRIRRPLCVLSLVFMILVYTFLELTGGVDEGEHIKDDSEVVAIGRISDIRSTEFGYQLLLDKTECWDLGSDDCEKAKQKLTEKDIGPRNNINNIIVYPRNNNVYELKIGQRVKVKGKYINFSLPENEGQFNQRKYYRIRGYDGQIKAAEIASVSKSYSRFKHFLYRNKNKTEKLYEANMDDTQAGTLSAMVLGDKRGLDEDVKDAYQSAGISHILSLSGLHISAVGMCLFTVLSKIGLGLYISSALSIFCIISYGIMTGLSTSTIRALIMFLIAIIGKNIGRTYDLTSAISVSAVFILLDNPYLIYDSGFLMSFLSVIGIGLLYSVLVSNFSDIKEQIVDWIYRLRHKNNQNLIVDSSLHNVIEQERETLYSSLKNKVLQSLCISISATLATLPVVINTFYKISRYGVFINLIVVPLMSLILGLGIVSAIVGNVLAGFRVFGSMVHISLLVTENILKFYTVLSDYTAKLPGNTWIIGKAAIWQNVVYIILLFITCVTGNIKNIRNGGRARDKTKIGVKIRPYICMSLLIIAVFIISYRKKDDYAINALSVGQGACNVVYGEDIPTVVIDGGSSDIKRIGKNRLIPFLQAKGIDTIDYLFVTHPDGDHINGIYELLENEYSGMRVKHVFVSAYDDKLFELLEKRNVKAHFMKNGDKVTFGKLKIECLSPESVYKGQMAKNDEANSHVITEDLNDKSLVLLVTYVINDEESHCFRSLFTGDISSDVELELVDGSREKLSDIDILSIPHHGSKYSSCKEFITEVNPKICTISAGENNSYGHPHKETLERLDEYAPSAKVLRTDECGQITVIVDKGMILIRRFRY